MSEYPLLKVGYSLSLTLIFLNDWTKLSCCWTKLGGCCVSEGWVVEGVPPLAPRLDTPLWEEFVVVTLSTGVAVSGALEGSSCMVGLETGLEVVSVEKRTTLEGRSDADVSLVGAVVPTEGVIGVVGDFVGFINEVMLDCFRGVAFLAGI